MAIAPIIVSDSLFLLPAAAKFIPTDTELVQHYLYNYIQGHMTPEQCYPVQESDLYCEKEPWELWRDHQIRSHREPDEAVYLFTKLKKKSKNAKYFERRIGNCGGSWHGEDSGNVFVKFRGGDGSMWAGKKRKFKYDNTKSEAEHGKWLLYEFRLENVESKSSFETAVCMLKMNGSPFAEKELGKMMTRKRKLDDILGDILHQELEFPGPALKKLQLDRKQSNSVDIAVPIVIQNETAAFQASVKDTTAVPAFQNETMPFIDVLDKDPNSERFTFTLEELFGGGSEPEKTEESSVEVAVPLIPTEIDSETTPYETEQETVSLEVDPDVSELGDFALILAEELESSSELPEAVGGDVHNIANVNEEEEAPKNDGSIKSKTDTEGPRIGDDQPAISTGKDGAFNGGEAEELVQMRDCEGVSTKMVQQQQPWSSWSLPQWLLDYSEEDSNDYIPIDNIWDFDDLLPLPSSYVSSNHV